MIFHVFYQCKALKTLPAIETVFLIWEDNMSSYCSITAGLTTFLRWCCACASSRPKSITSLISVSIQVNELLCLIMKMWNLLLSVFNGLVGSRCAKCGVFFENCSIYWCIALMQWKGHRLFSNQVRVFYFLCNGTLLKAIASTKLYRHIKNNTNILKI